MEPTREKVKQQGILPLRCGNDQDNQIFSYTIRGTVITIDPAIHPHGWLELWRVKGYIETFFQYKDRIAIKSLRLLDEEGNVLDTAQ